MMSKLGGGNRTQHTSVNSVLDFNSSSINGKGEPLPPPTAAVALSDRDIFVWSTLILSYKRGVTLSILSFFFFFPVGDCGKWRGIRITYRGCLCSGVAVEGVGGEHDGQVPVVTGRARPLGSVSGMVKVSAGVEGGKEGVCIDCIIDG